MPYMPIVPEKHLLSVKSQPGASHRESCFSSTLALKLRLPLRSNAQVGRPTGQNGDIRHRIRLKSGGLVPSFCLWLLQALPSFSSSSSPHLSLHTTQRQAKLLLRSLIHLERLFQVRVLGLSSCQVISRMTVTGSITRSLRQIRY
jgi:hypothetical protein